jgi:hypothetical protein
MREICMSGLTRGEAAEAPPLLYCIPCPKLVFAFSFLVNKPLISQNQRQCHVTLLRMALIC